MILWAIELIGLRDIELPVMARLLDKGRFIGRQSNFHFNCHLIVSCTSLCGTEPPAPSLKGPGGVLLSLLYVTIRPYSTENISLHGLFEFINLRFSFIGCRMVQLRREKPSERRRYHAG